MASSTIAPQTDELDFVYQVRDMSDSELLQLYGVLAKERLKSLLHISYEADKLAETELYLAYSEIEHRIKNDNWHPIKPRKKRTF